jgi:hypothetical protein
MMRNLNVDSRGARIAEAAAKIGSLEYAEQVRLAATTKNGLELEVLADFDGQQIVECILDNPFTPAAALEKLLKRYDAASNEDVLRSFIFRIATHPGTRGALQEYLSKHHRWEIRYAIAMRTDASVEVLETLANDGHLAVKAMASRSLGLPPVDDGFDLMEMRCAELNQTFEQFLQGLKTQKILVDKLVESFGMEKDGYDQFNGFSRKCFDALREMRDNIIHHHAALMQRRYIPNIDLETEDIEKTMAALGADHFDAYIIAAKVKQLMEKSSELSMEEIRNRARELLPYAYSDDRYWGPASKPELILNGRRLKLKCHVSTYGDDHASIDTKHMESIEALDQIGKIVLNGIDPAKVASRIAERLFHRRTQDTIFTKIQTGSPMLSLRFFKNGTLIVEYESEEMARKVAEAFVSSPKSVN